MILRGPAGRLPFAPALRNQTVRRILPAYFLSALGDGMAVVAVSWFAIQLAPSDGRAVWVGVAAAAYTLPAALGALTLGRFVRDWPPSRLVGADATLRACALVVIPLLFAVNALNIVAYALLLTASSVLHSWGQAGIFTLLAHLLPEEDRLAGNALLSTIGASTTIIGPALAAPLIAVAGPAVVIAVDATTFAVLAATFLFCVRVPPATAEPDLPKSNSSGFALIRHQPALSGLLGLSFGFFLLFGTVYVALPLRVADDYQGSAALLAAHYTAFGVGAVVGGIAVGLLRRIPLWPATIGIVTAVGAALLPLGLEVPEAVTLASFAAVGLLWPPYSSLSTTLVQGAAPRSLLPSVLAASSSIRVLAVPLGTALGGPLVATLNAGGALRLTASCVLGLGALAATAYLLTRRR